MSGSGTKRAPLFGGSGNPQARATAAEPAVACLPDLMALFAREVQPLRPKFLLCVAEAAHVFAGDGLNRHGSRTDRQCGCREQQECTHRPLPLANRVGTSDIECHEQAPSLKKSRAVVQRGEGKFTAFRDAVVSSNPGLLRSV